MFSYQLVDVVVVGNSGDQVRITFCGNDGWVSYGGLAFQIPDLENGSPAVLIREVSKKQKMGSGL
jgi:hypothetical protein